MTPSRAARPAAPQERRAAGPSDWGESRRSSASRGQQVHVLTDTHGYTEINFAAFGMVGMRFCPRIRSLHRQRIYCADPGRDHGVLEPVLKRGRRAVNFRLIAEQWDRIGQFYAAFPAAVLPVRCCSRARRRSTS